MTAGPATPAPRRAAVAGLVLVTVSAVCFGSAGPVAKLVIGLGVSPWQLTQLRITGAALVFLLLALLRSPAALRLRARELPLVVAYGLVAFVGIQAFYFTAVSRLPVGIALLLEYLGPVLVALWARFVQRRRLRPLTWVAAACALLGLALIGEVWRDSHLDGLGVLAGFGAALCLAGYFLLGEHGVTTGRDPIALAALGTAVGALAMAVVSPPWRLPLRLLAEPTALGPPGWALLAWVVLVGTVGAYLTGILSLRFLTAPVAGVLATAEVVVAAAVAWLLLGETLTAVQLTGASVLLTGVVLAQLPSRAQPGPTG
ncbi:drug/metabolite transporter (DMT)-like permease [Crossiella equi]|uniref:Drug/metabolite transporter (DMT)-like permease n=1 Tax=Crossiella equi TaxID=130796 RepID=A0ABS5ALP5_9PSEU|nr:DMT family transporter [Crossiella equi]MBP2477197.1 drug/metabolite transporter (DMT)-like permease [Crossiella equi]